MEGKGKIQGGGEREKKDKRRVRDRWWKRRELESRVEGEKESEGGNESNLEAQRNSCQHQYCKIMDFLLIIPPLLWFNYPLPKLSVRLQVWPHTERPLHLIKQLDLLTLHLFSNHDMTFQVCQVRAVPALCAALLLRALRRYTTLITVTL